MEDAKQRGDFDAYALEKFEFARSLLEDSFAQKEAANESAFSNNPTNVTSIDSYLKNRTAVENKIKTEEAAAPKLERKAKVAPKTTSSATPKSTIEFPKKHTYDVPTYTETEGGTMYSGTVGSKANTLDTYRIANVAKAVRGDLKEAQAKGYLPKNLKFGVRSESYSGGSSLHVTIQGVDDKDHYEKDWNGDQRRTEKAKELLNRVENITGAYGSKSVHGEIDYFNVSYYDHVTIEDSKDRDYREKSAARQKMVNAANKVKKTLASDYATKGPQVLMQNGFKFTGETKDGKKVGRIPGTHFLAVASENPVASTGYSYQVYDFHKYEEKKENGLDEQLSSLNSSTIGYRYGKLRFI
jgi:hypothetical protein